MEISKPIELARISEIKILQNVKLLHRMDLNPIHSTRNLRVQFEVSGEVRGAITCHLCLDDHDLNASEKNYIYPLFVEAMNILVGKQISLDDELSHFKIHLSSPKLSLQSIDINTSLRSVVQKYDLELEHHTFCVLTEYLLEALN